MNGKPSGIWFPPGAAKPPEKSNGSDVLYLYRGYYGNSNALRVPHETGDTRQTEEEEIT
jgi:hypothetical protein